jgi:group I intron endonuclease
MRRGRENRYLPPYERHHDSSGIYLISMPEASGLVYIGSAAQTIRHRWRQHICDLLAKRHGNSLLQRAVDKHGIEKLRFEILELCAAEDVVQREQEWFGRYDWDDLFNLNPNAASRLGCRLSDEDRLKLAESHGGISSPEILQRIAEEYMQGATQESLAKKYKVDRTSIRNYLVRLNVETRRLASANPDIVAKVRQTYAEGFSSGQCAKMAGIDQGTAIRILRECGLLRSVSAAQKLVAGRRDRKDYAKLTRAHVHDFAHPEHGVFRGYQFELVEKFGLAKSYVSQLCNGYRDEVSGWRLTSEPKKAENRRQKAAKVHDFVHPEQGDFVGTQGALMRTFGGMTQAGVSGLVTGRWSSYKGWEIRDPSGPHVFREGSHGVRSGKPRNTRRKIPVEDNPPQPSPA